ncbi:putative Serine/threonine-protein phosphatase 5 [Paratrimastix pyriformis]|uniref:Serine/threonine-protein phosphatase n=1 Tax=Paratrimastix pyriformis TaxID=342808 RepID=A0ABQ8U707_9EUKA|nr:putative Serine/threonine-protein phosphatase 5 [Paratrimastix pyriformis]
MFYLWLKGFQHTLLGKGVTALSSETSSIISGSPKYSITSHGRSRKTKAQKRLKPAQVLKIVDAVRTQLAALPNVLEVEVRDGQDLTVVVCDPPAHEWSSLVSDTEIAFYTCRVPVTTYRRHARPIYDIVLTLFMYKLVYPNHVHLLRGNHESQTCTRVWLQGRGQRDKYNVSIYNSFMTCFNYLPCCAVINQRTFIVHGGLFNREGVTLQELNRMNRVTEPGEEPGEGLLAQMLWSDPTDMYGRHSSLRPFGCSFGPNVTEEFLGINHLQMIIRSHEVRPNGYSVEHGGKLITVFSAPNYCQDTNQGGYLRLKGQYLDVQFLQFQGVPSPPAKTYFQPPVCLLS